MLGTDSESSPPATEARSTSTVDGLSRSDHDSIGHVSLDTAAPVPSTSSGSSDGLQGLLSSVMDSNPYFSAGAGLMGLGVVLSLLQKSTVHAATFARRRLLVTLELTSTDVAYPWLLHWITHHVSTASQSSIQSGLSSRLSKLGAKSHQLAVETSFSGSGHSAEVKFGLVPGPGLHYFRYRNAWFQAKRERSGKTVGLQSGAPWETTTLTTLSRDRDLFPTLLAEARELAKAAAQGKTIIYTAWATEWRPFGQPQSPRWLESVILDEGQKERIVNDIQNFIGRSTWYAERGIPYRRGYLLHGPPGSGKSSFILALAGSLGYNICALNLSERGQTDDKLNHLLANVPERSIVLLEDVDAAFVGRSASGELRSNVTFSGLLNAVDGVASSTSQRILFMTTNHVKRLDPALIRPGRIDLVETLGDATSYQAGTLYSKFYVDTPGISETELSRMRKLVQDIVAEGTRQGKYVSMAELQGVFIRSSAGEAVGRVEQVLGDAAARDARLREAGPRLVGASSL